ncbi:MAG TPA: hypothetical protein VHL78_09400 [Actinomycetota bacterium]|nr:hypothetical protein [Actinomycetota bacterium]
MSAGPRGRSGWRGALALAAILLLSACRLVGGGADGQDAADGEEPPALAPAAELGSVALTASCSASDEGRVRTLSLGGTYDCQETFTVTMQNAGPTPTGALQMQLVLRSVSDESDGPVVGPTGTETDAPTGDFDIASASAEGASCEVGGGVAVCAVDGVPSGEAISVALGISPAPGGATVTTEVGLGETQ